MVPYLRAISTASITASEVFGASAAKMPPVWNQRTPSSPKIFSQFTSPGLICDAAQAVELAPDDLRGVDSALHHQVFDQPAEVVDGQRGHGRGAFAPAFAHGT